MYTLSTKVTLQCAVSVKLTTFCLIRQKYLDYLGISSVSRCHSDMLNNIHVHITYSISEILSAAL